MDVLDRARAAIAGSEFAWLLVDANGAVARCETAGFGEVPDALLAHGAKPLPVVLPEAAEGLYVYAWQPWAGPYQRMVVPQRPIHVRALAAVLREHAWLPSVALDFAHTEAFQLRDLLACRGPRTCPRPG